MFRLVFALILCVSSFSFASEKIQIQSMSAVAAKVAELRQQMAARDVLVVFDIDNTSLTTNQDLGGDAWFAWQEAKLKNNDRQDLVATDFAGLLQVQGWLYALGSMHAPEAETPAMVGGFQSQSMPVFWLTSRGAEFESFTERELVKNKYETSWTAPGPRFGFAGKYLPYDIENPERDCVSKEELQVWGLKAASPVAYHNGVMYTGGQHKGAMLRTLLCRVQMHPRAIVFVDDTEKHVDRVLKAFEQSDIQVYSMRYGKMDSQVERFHKSDKSEVIQAWNLLKDAIAKAFAN